MENRVFLFSYHSSGHTAFAENVHSEGAQPRMRDAYYSGRMQRMVSPDGTPKGMKQVLEERGMNLRKIKTEDIRASIREN